MFSLITMSLSAMRSRYATRSATAMRPKTPPTSTPLDEDQRRFEEIDLPEEWVEDYHPGGLHPVHLEDTFKQGQYRVCRKLGNGSFSTVWLATDTTYV